MSQFLNTLGQITRSDSVGVLPGIGRHLHWQLRRALGQFPCELRISQSVLFVDQPGGVAALVNAMGEYDFNNMRLLRLVLSLGQSTFFDIGANIGTYTLIASEVGHATVVSVEPHPTTFALLQQNVKQNARENVACLNLAVSEVDGEVRMTNVAESAINRVVRDRKDGAGVLSVPCRRVETICRELRLVPDFVKIDVEGHEDEVLRGFGEFANSAKMIFIEGGEREAVQRWMAEAGYTGPWFPSFKRGLFSAKRQARPEDPVFVQRDFLSEVRRLDLLVSEQPWDR